VASADEPDILRPNSEGPFGQPRWTEDFSMKNAEIAERRKTSIARGVGMQTQV